jgi:hypothetical protein
MKSFYRGYELRAERVDRRWIDWSIVREDNGFVASEGAHESPPWTVPTVMKDLVWSVNHELEKGNPFGEQEATE